MCRFLALLVLSVLFYMFFVSVAYAAPGLPSPLNPELSNIPSFIAKVLQAMVMISLPILTLFIVYSGFLFISARGKPGQLETAKSNFLYVIIGIILILGAWVIATLIGGTVKQLIDPTPSPCPSGQVLVGGRCVAR